MTLRPREGDACALRLEAEDETVAKQRCTCEKKKRFSCKSRLLLIISGLDATNQQTYIYIYISCDWADHMSNFASTLCLSPCVGPEARLLQLVAVHKDAVKDVSRTGANVPAKHLRSRSSDRGRELNARHDSYIECFDVGRTGFLIVVANQRYMFSHVFPTLVL